MKEKITAVYEEECYQIRGALYDVYTVLGTGFSEEVYQEALEKSLLCAISRLYHSKSCGFHTKENGSQRPTKQIWSVTTKSFSN